MGTLTDLVVGDYVTGNSSNIGFDFKLAFWAGLLAVLVVVIFYVWRA